MLRVRTNNFQLSTLNFHLSKFSRALIFAPCAALVRSTGSDLLERVVLDRIFQQLAGAEDDAAAFDKRMAELLLGQRAGAAELQLEAAELAYFDNFAFAEVAAHHVDQFVEDQFHIARRGGGLGRDQVAQFIHVARAGRIGTGVIQFRTNISDCEPSAASLRMSLRRTNLYFAGITLGFLGKTFVS